MGVGGGGGGGGGQVSSLSIVAKQAVDFPQVQASYNLIVYFQLRLGAMVGEGGGGD